MPGPQPLVAQHGHEGQVLLEALDLVEGERAHSQRPRQVIWIRVVQVHAGLPRVALQRLLLELHLEGLPEAEQLPGGDKGAIREQFEAGGQAAGVRECPKCRMRFRLQDIVHHIYIQLSSIDRAQQMT